MNRFARIIFLVALISIPAIGLFHLADLHFAFSGFLSSEYDFKKKSPIISLLRPYGRLGEIKEVNNETVLPIEIEPVYFSVNMPTFFHRVNVSLKYHEDSPDLFYLGPQTREGFFYELSPVRYKTLDDLKNSDDWIVTSDENNVTLFQNRSSAVRYKSVDAFLTDLPKVEEIAVFNYSLAHDYEIKNYRPSKRVKVLTPFLRGTHSLLTYVENEDLNFEFSIQDINRHDGEDSLELTVLSKGLVVYQETMEDDGFVLGTDPASEERIMKVSLENLPKGVYQIKLTGTEDTVINKIKTTAQKLVFEKKLYLVNNEEYKGLNGLTFASTNLWSNGEKFSMRTTHASGIQPLQFGETNLEINETHKLFFAENKNDLVKIISPKNDLILTTEGVFSLDKESFFDPRVKELVTNAEELPKGVNYILARYNFPKELGNGFYRKDFSFDLGRYYVNDKSLEFMISSPNLAQAENEILLNNINIDLERNPITLDKIMKRLKK